jgi:hypothetical protein
MFKLASKRMLREHNFIEKVLLRLFEIDIIENCGVMVSIPVSHSVDAEFETCSRQGLTNLIEMFVISLGT